MTRHKSFTTAAARRRADPVVWTIDEYEVRLLPHIDTAAYGALIMAVTMQPTEEGWAGIMGKQQAILDAMRVCVDPASLDAWDAALEVVEPALIGELAQEMIAEFSGAPDPTLPSSSVSGSSATGTSSTGGAQPEASMPQPSLLTEDSTSTSTPSESTPTTSSAQRSTKR